MSTLEHIDGPRAGIGVSDGVNVCVDVGIGVSVGDGIHRGGTQ